MTRDLVFISYSQRDKAWKDAVLTVLKGYTRRGHLQVWADEYIQVGDVWRREIHDALARARAAVLLISTDFVGSDFIMDVEVPALVKAVKEHDLFLWCIAVRSVDPDVLPELTQYQWWGRPEAPLDRLSQEQREEQLVGAMKALVKRYKEWSPPARHPPTGAAVRSRAAAAASAMEATVASAAAPPLESAPVPGNSDHGLASSAAQALVAAAVQSLPQAGTAGSATLHGVPPLPPHFVPRAQVLVQLKRALLEQPQHTFAIAAHSREGLYGQGGIGKTVLAIALARDAEVQRAFGDGIYWLTLGQTPDIVGLQRALYHQQSGAWIEFEAQHVGTSVLREKFAPLNCLLVLDDVWQSEHAQAFQVLGPRGRLLVTTRDLALLDALGARVQNLEALAPDDALELLAHWVGVERANLPDAASEVSSECGGLPLALSLAGAQVRGGVSWGGLLSELQRGNLRFLDHPHGSVFASLSTSVHALPPNEAIRYAELAIFPEDTPVPARVIERLWSQAGVNAVEARQLLARFAQRALLRLQGEGEALQVSFHDLQADYLRLLITDAPELHGRLLDAYQRTLPDAPTVAARWAALPASEAYLWRHLVYHALEAGRSALLETLATDAGWLSAKLNASGVSALQADLARLVERAPSERTQAVERAVRLDSAWLYQAPAALHDLLYNRLRADGLGPSSIEQLIARIKPAVRLSHPVDLGGERRQFRGHTDHVTACAYSPDGTRALSASWDNTLREWDCASGKQLRLIQGHTGIVTACAYSPDGTRVLSASFNNLREWDCASGKQLRLFQGVRMCAYSPDGTRVLSASSDNTLREWDGASDKQLGLFLGHTDRVNACAYSPDGARILSASSDGTLREWNCASGQELRFFLGHTDQVNACAYSPDGARILSASSDGTLREWNCASGQELRRFQGSAGWTCAYSRDGSRVLSGSKDMSLREWDRASGRELRYFHGHTSVVTACAYSPDGTRVLSASFDNTLREWDSTSRKQLRPFQGHTAAVTACAYSPDGSRVLWAPWDTTLRERDRASGRELRRFQGLSSHVTACAYSPDGTRVLSACVDGTLREWDDVSGRQLKSFQGHTERVTACTYSPDGSRVLSGSEDRTLLEWDDASGEKLRRFEGHSDVVRACAYSPDGSRVLSGSEDRTLLEWDCASGEQLRRFQGHTNAVMACAYHPGGSHVLSASYDTTVLEWDCASGEQPRRFQGLSSSACVIACAYSPSGRFVIAACSDSTVMVWERDCGACVHTLYGAAPFVSLCVCRGHIAAGDELGNLWMLEVEWLD